MNDTGSDGRPRLWLLAGGNGSGKSTFYRRFLSGTRFVNADVIARDLYVEAAQRRSYEAAQAAAAQLDLLLSLRADICFETVFSHPSKVDVIAKAKALGYEITLVVMHVEDPTLNVARVHSRVSNGGHSVPDEKITARLPRTKHWISVAIPLCDDVLLIDNSQTDNSRPGPESANAAMRPVTRISNGRLKPATDQVPDWVSEYLPGSSE